jgi:hypothetical protein
MVRVHTTVDLSKKRTTSNTGKLRMVTFRMRLFAYVAVGFHSRTVMVRSGSGRELAIVCIVFACTHVEITAEDDISRRGPIAVSVETVASAAAAAAAAAAATAAAAAVVLPSRVVTAS